MVFGGGEAGKVADLAGTAGCLLHLSKGLGLNNSGDSVTLLRADGSTSDAVKFGKEGGKDRSLVRKLDGDIKSALVAHPGDKPFSPGTKSDGTNF